MGARDKSGLGDADLQIVNGGKTRSYLRLPLLTNPMRFRLPKCMPSLLDVQSELQTKKIGMLGAWCWYLLVAWDEEMQSHAYDSLICDCV